MTEFEAQLAKALIRKDPPPQLAPRILSAAAREDAERGGKRRRWPFFTSLRVFAPAMLALLIAASGAMFEHREEIERGRAAKQQLLVAVRIAGEKLQSTQQKVAAISEAN